MAAKGPAGLIWSHGSCTIQKPSNEQSGVDDLLGVNKGTPYGNFQGASAGQHCPPFRTNPGIAVEGTRWARSRAEPMKLLCARLDETLFQTDYATYLAASSRLGSCLALSWQALVDLLATLNRLWMDIARDAALRQLISQGMPVFDRCQRDGDTTSLNHRVHSVPGLTHREAARNEGKRRRRLPHHAGRNQPDLTGGTEAVAGCGLDRPQSCELRPNFEFMTSHPCRASRAITLKFCKPTTFGPTPGSPLMWARLRMILLPTFSKSAIT